MVRPLNMDTGKDDVVERFLNRNFHSGAVGEVDIDMDLYSTVRFTGESLNPTPQTLLTQFASTRTP